MARFTFSSRMSHAGRKNSAVLSGRANANAFCGENGSDLPNPNDTVGESLQKKRDWIRNMRLKFTPSEMILEDGSLNQRYLGALLVVSLWTNV